MADYEIGYGKPPKGGRFKAGVSGNPKGRPKRRPTPLVVILKDVFGGAIEYREHGRRKVGIPLELALKMLVDRAVAGTLSAAESCSASESVLSIMAILESTRSWWRAGYPTIPARPRSRRHATSR